ncbi:MAG: PqqD family protein [Kiritimatiellae bacterium]|nr:PqqD family protein [Kiritimatiellia bacterium]
MFGRNTRQAPIDRRRSLAAVPVVNEGVNAAEGDAGRLILTVAVPRGRGLLARFRPRFSQKRIKLDELGSFVFSRIDGKRNVRTIIRDFIVRYGTNRREAELSTVDFLRSLARRYVISIVVK